MHIIYCSSFDNVRYLRTFPPLSTRHPSYELIIVVMSFKLPSGAQERVAEALWGGMGLTQLRCPFAKSLQRNVAHRSRTLGERYILLYILYYYCYTHTCDVKIIIIIKMRQKVRSLRSPTPRAASRSPNRFQLRSERNPQRSADGTFK